MATSGTMKVNVVGDASKFNRAMDSAQGKMKRLGEAAKKFGKIAAAGIAAAGAAAVTGAFKVAEFGDEVAKSAGKAGLGVEQFQELRFAFEQGGVEAGTFDTAVQKFNKRLGESATTGGTADDAFAALNVSLRDADGNVREASGAMEEILPKLANVESNSERAAIAGDLFGQRAGPELAAALADGGGGIDAAREKAQELGIVMGEEAAEKAEKFADGWDDVKKSTLGLLRTGLTPLMSWMADEAFPFIKNKIVPALSDFRDWIGPKITKAAKGISKFLSSTLVPAFEGLSAWWNKNGPAIMSTAEDIWGAIQTMSAIVSAAIGVVVGWFDKSEGKASKTGKNVAATFSTLKDTLAAIFDAIAAVVSTVIGWIQRAWEQWGDDIFAFAKAQFNNVLDAIDGILTAIGGVFDVFAGIFTGDWERVWDGVKAIFSGVWDTIKAVVSQAFDSIRLIWTVFRDSFSAAWNAAWTTVKDFVANRIDDVVSFVTGLPGRAKSALMGAWSAYSEFWSNVWTEVKDFVSDRVDDIVDFVVDFPRRIVSGLGNIGSVLLDAGKKLIKGLANGISSAGSAVVDAIKDVFKEAWGKVTDMIPGVGGGEGDGPGFGVPDVSGGSALKRAQAAMEGLPVRVTSTYRSPAENARVGGSPTSYHLDKSNPAADIGGPTWALDIVNARLKAMNKNRELLWRTAGHFDHVHVAHEGGTVTRQGIEPLRADEVLAKLRSGETVRTRQQEAGLRGSGTTINQTFVSSGNVRADAQAAKLALMRG